MRQILAIVAGALLLAACASGDRKRPVPPAPEAHGCPPSLGGRGMERKLAAIFALDMVSFSRLMEADEEGTLKRHRSHITELLEPSIELHHGHVVKGTGDGLLCEFASAVDAVECAAEVQRAMPAREEGVQEDRRIEYRIGINVGDIVVEDGDIYGDGVNVAARIESLADPGGVFLSESAFNQVKSKVELGFEDLGSHTVKNIDEPVHVYRVLLDPGAAGTSPGGRHVLRQFIRRRVPQLTGVYLAVSWAFLEFVDWAVNQYGLSPTLSSFVVSLLLLLLPTVIWFAWHHGSPGPDGWTKSDGIVVATNVAIAAGILFLGAGFTVSELTTLDPVGECRTARWGTRSTPSRTRPLTVTVTNWPGRSVSSGLGTTPRKVRVAVAELSSGSL